MARKRKNTSYKNALYKNPFINKFLISIVIAVFMLMVALGVVQGEIFIPIPYILVLFAISFIIGSVFFENKGVNKLHSLIGGCIFALIVVFSIITFISGVEYLFNDAVNTYGYELLISAFAICMIISIISYNVITRDR
ncbi:MAG: heat-shock protein [Methanosarcinaceae archaeon]|jgi:cation transport ATPase|nr:heat-shock protein [Methanosarcinaceae archaeon]NKQ37921.1 heat-shock protein [Methanosarcinales archaeon]